MLRVFFCLPVVFLPPLGDYAGAWLGSGDPPSISTEMFWRILEHKRLWWPEEVEMILPVLTPEYLLAISFAA